MIQIQLKRRTRSSTRNMNINNVLLVSLLSLLSFLNSFHYTKASFGLTPKPFNVIIVGGSSGMGKATAVSTVKRGGNVLIVSRNEEKLISASREILDEV